MLQYKKNVIAQLSLNRLILCANFIHSKKDRLMDRHM